MGTDAALFRTMGGRAAVRTEQYDSRWLNGELLYCHSYSMVTTKAYFITSLYVFLFLSLILFLTLPLSMSLFLTLPPPSLPLSHAFPVYTVLFLLLLLPFTSFLTLFPSVLPPVSLRPPPCRSSSPSLSSLRRVSPVPNEFSKHLHSAPGEREERDKLAGWSPLPRARLNSGSGPSD